MKNRRDLIMDVLNARAMKRQDGKLFTYRDVAKHLYPKEDQDSMAALLNKMVKNPDYYPGEEACKRLKIVHREQKEVCPIHGVVHEYNCEEELPAPACPHCGEVPLKRKCSCRSNGNSNPKPRPKMVSLGKLTPEEDARVMAIPPAERLRRILDGR